MLWQYDWVAILCEELGKLYIIDVICIISINRIPNSFYLFIYLSINIFLYFLDSSLPWFGSCRTYWGSQKVLYNSQAFSCFSLTFSIWLPLSVKLSVRWWFQNWRKWMQLFKKFTCMLFYLTTLFIVHFWFVL